MTSGILDMNNIEGSRMSFTVDDCSDSTGVTTSGDHAQVAGLELDRVHDLVGVDVQSDNVVNLNKKVSSLNYYV